MRVSADCLEVLATRKQTTMISDLPEVGKSSPTWRWNNIPLPEPHMAGILTSGVLHCTRPWRLNGSRRLYRGVGWTLVGTGVAISASAVRAASEVDLGRPSTLISSGPYAISRNPMYVGWTSLYLGELLSRGTPGWSHHFQSWKESSTGTFFEKSISWSKYSGKNTFSTGSWFVDTFNSWCRKPRCQRALLQYQMRKSVLVWLTQQTNPGTNIQKPPVIAGKPRFEIWTIKFVGVSLRCCTGV